MNLQVFYPDDIRNALQAAELASATALQAASDGTTDEFAEGYKAGHRAALVTLALAFGIRVGIDKSSVDRNVTAVSVLELDRRNVR